MTKDIVLEGRHVRLQLPGKIKGSLIRAQVNEGLSCLTETVIEFLSTDLDLDLQKLIGERLLLEIDAPEDKERFFQGRCVAVEFLGARGEQGFFRARLRPWLWFLSRATDCRIFQDKSVIDILKDVFGQHGFSDFRDLTRHRYAKRPYCVQFRETDFDFVSRLMEEEGIYYFFDHDKARETLMLVDEASAHKALKDQAKLEFFPQLQDYRRGDDHVFEWSGGESIQTGKVTFQDYDFEKPKSDLKAVRAMPKGRNKYNGFENYAYPGRYSDVPGGEHLARIRAEGLAAQAQRSHGTSNARRMMAGGKFKLEKHPRKAENTEYLILNACHQLQADTDLLEDDVTRAILGPALDFDSLNSPDIYRCVFTVQPLREPFRAPQCTPRPDLSGIQTARVVGKKGEEIWTDKHGRVKIQFHWDRMGKSDENASCWVRCAVPWSGKGFGTLAVPRIGQEVIVQFENGDPDRPLITGMVYNGDTKFPYPLPTNQTQFGFRTQSSKNGTGFSELIFEDKKDAEFVRLQSERDFHQIIKNNAEITVGLEHKKAGFFKQTIHGDKTETINTGDHAFTVAAGKETLKIAKDRSADIGGADKTTVNADHSLSVSKGADWDIGAALNIAAKSKITLTCGASKIEITPSKITMSAPQVDIAATATAKLTANGQLKMEGKGQAALKGAGMLTLEGGGMTQLKSSGLLNVKGSLTMIN